ncbi:hypothetical protein AZA_40414 [Nitrospirillum viridazoti Y2]|nr:hypothetical protein AZA_40414 [Nitrospirillum amazonense Y2]
MQHHDAVRDLRHDRQVVRNVQRRGALLAHHPLEGAQHVDLGGDVQGGGRLVQDHQLRIGHQGHCGHQPLQLPARQLVDIARADGFRLGQGQGAEQA